MQNTINIIEDSCLSVINSLAGSIRGIKSLEETSNEHAGFFSMDLDKLLGVLLSQIIYYIPRGKQAELLYINGLEEYIDDLDERWKALEIEMRAAN